MVGGYNIDYYVKSSINDPSNMGFESIHHDFLITIEHFVLAKVAEVTVTVMLIPIQYTYIYT